MKFEINSKELKEMIGKVQTVICKKSSLKCLTRIYFEQADGKLHITGTNLEHYIDVFTNNVVFDSVGESFGIDIDDIKMLLKMNGDIHITKNKNIISVLCGKKTVDIKCYEKDTCVNTPKLVAMENIISAKENWLLETLINLSIFTSKDSTNKIMKCFNINVLDNCIEALDGHKVAIRKLEEGVIKSSNTDNVMLNNICLPILKKVLDKKSVELINVSANGKYIKVSGKDFEYIQKVIEGQYFKVNTLLKDCNKNIEMTFKKNNILEIADYICSMIKADNEAPMVFNYSNGKIYSYFKNFQMKVVDEVEANNVKMEENYLIGFNPIYLQEAFKIVDCDNVECYGINNKSPFIINGNEYKFVVLPINIAPQIINKVVEDFNKQKSEK